MAQVGVGAIEHEQVGEAAYGDTQVGFGAIFPHRVQVCPVTAGNGHGGEEIGGLEAGAVDDHIHVVMGAGAVGEAALIHRADAVIDDLHMVLCQGRVVIVGHQNALAAHGVIRGQFLAQGGILDLLLQVTTEQPLVHLHGLLEGGKAQGP